MKTICWILLFSMIHLIGCSTTHFINHGQSTYDKLNENAQGNRIRITLMNNEIIDTDNVKVGVDSSHWIKTVENRKPIEGGHTYLTEEKKRVVATEAIASIYIKNVNKGLVVGLAVGGLAALLAYANTPSGRIVPKEKIWWAFLVIPVITTGIGAAIGFEKKYIFQSEDDIIFEQYENGIPQDLDNSPVRVEFSMVITKDIQSIVISWKNKKIRLLNSEYMYRGTTEYGKQYIVVPKYIYESKFK